MAIKIVIKTKPPKTCYGCGISTHSENFYEGDPTTAWCDDCYVTDEKLKEIQARMPFCQKPPTKFRIVSSLTSKPKPKKIKCTVVSHLSVPFD